MQQRGFLVEAARLGSESTALSVPLRGLIRTPSRAERGQGHENRRRRFKPAPLGFARVRISHLIESFENVGVPETFGVLARSPNDDVHRPRRLRDRPNLPLHYGKLAGSAGFPMRLAADSEPRVACFAFRRTNLRRNDCS